MSDRLLWMLKASRAMMATRDLDALLRLVTDTLIEATESERGFILLHEGESLVPRLGRSAAGQTLAAGEARISSIAQRVFETRRAIFATDTGQDDELARRHSVDELNLKMMVCVPLATEQEVLGVFYADRPTRLDSVFTTSNRRAIETLAEHAAAAVHNARLFDRAIRDPLTGLFNTGYFVQHLEQALRHDAPQSIGVLLIDLDQFKRINQQAGAEAGDAVLRTVAAAMAVEAGPHLIARYGSDKFAVLARGLGAGQLQRLAERYVALLHDQRHHGVQLSACIGSILVDTHRSRPGAVELITAADDALSSARSRGFGQIEQARLERP